MTKTLTEQWRDGELECGYYYIKVNPKCGQDTVVAYYVNFEGYFYTRLGAWRNDVIKEVLAPVPSYDEWQESQKKRALWFDKYKIETYKLEQKIQELEKQIKEANNLFLQIQNKLENEPEEKTMTETRIYESIDVYLTKWAGKDWWMKNE